MISYTEGRNCIMDTPETLATLTHDTGRKQTKQAQNNANKKRRKKPG